LPIFTVDQGLKVALQMSPTPLQAFQPPVHLGSVAMDHAAKRLADQFGQHRRGARRSQRKDRERAGHAGPQPSFVHSLFAGRFVDAQHRLLRQMRFQLGLGRLQGASGLLLELHDPARRAGLAEHLLQK
jgi:hypothetical protein